MLFIDGLRRERESSIAAYHQFLLRDPQYPLDFHAFFEGQDDLSFYINFLNDFVVDSFNIHVYKCGNKRGVYEVYRRITATTRQGKPLFFVDKDLSNFLDEALETAPNIYVTDLYSIENYLVSNDMLIRVWTELFHFSGVILEINDFHKSRFQEELERFYSFMLSITAWAVYLRRNGKRPNINNITFSRLFKLNDDLVLEESEELKQIGQITFLERLCSEKTPEGWSDEASNILQELSTVPPQSYIRGKLELGFFVKFIEKLLKMINNALSQNERVSLRTQLSGENAIEILGPRLSIPKSLKEFLQKNMAS